MGEGGGSRSPPLLAALASWLAAGACWVGSEGKDGQVLSRARWPMCQC